MTEATARLGVRDGVAAIALDNPPVNALSASLRGAIWNALDDIAGRPAIAAVVIGSEHDVFSAGADIRELGQPTRSPTLSELANRIEKWAVPVIAALSGATLGAGTELALAAHYRVADRAARLGMPEVTLGLVPSAGGTQRLPRLIGARATLELLLGGRAVPATRAQELKLIDGIVDGGDVLSAGHAFARRLIERAMPPRPTRDRREGLMDAAGNHAAIAEWRRAVTATPAAAPARIVDCIEAALLLPFEAGLTFEAEAAADCLRDPASHALRHVFVAERRVSRDLVVRIGETGRSVTPAGDAIAERLRGAMRRAIDHLVSLGVAPSRIDAALLDFGFLEAPFGAAAPGLAGSDLARIQRRIVAAMMAEGCRLVEQGRVRRPSDIDAIAVHGMGFPRRRGGPMRAATAMGLIDLRAQMQRWSEESRIWTAPFLMSEAIKYAAGFEDIPEGRLRPE